MLDCVKSVRDFIQKNQKTVKIIVLPKIQHDFYSCFLKTYKILKNLDIKKNLRTILDKYLSRNDNTHSTSCNGMMEGTLVDYADMPKELLKYVQTKKVFNNEKLVG